MKYQVVSIGRDEVLRVLTNGGRWRKNGKHRYASIGEAITGYHMRATPRDYGYPHIIGPRGGVYTIDGWRMDAQMLADRKEKY